MVSLAETVEIERVTEDDDNEGEGQREEDVVVFDN